MNGMNLTCPHCGYSRELVEERRPAVPVRVTCPACREQFRFDPTGAAAAVAPPSVAAPDLPKAGFWIRVVASAVDTALVTGVQMLLGFALLAAVLALTGGAGDEAQALGMMITWCFGPVLGAAYYVVFTGYCGQTPGKMAVRVKVIRTDGSDIGYGRALLRETLGKFVSALIFGIGYLMVAFDARKQGLHDRIADTYVVKL
jgi:uncharacterized RDD family membrane protein YckC